MRRALASAAVAVKIADRLKPLVKKVRLVEKRGAFKLKGRLARRLGAGQRLRITVVATDRAGNKSRRKKARLRPAPTPASRP